MTAETINDNAGKPKRVSVDGQSAEQHSIKDQIDAERFEKSQGSATSKKRGITLARFRHQGSV